MPLPITVVENVSKYRIRITYVLTYVGNGYNYVQTTSTRLLWVAGKGGGGGGGGGISVHRRTPRRAVPVQRTRTLLELVYYYVGKQRMHGAIGSEEPRGKRWTRKFVGPSARNLGTAARLDGKK